MADPLTWTNVTMLARSIKNLAMQRLPLALQGYRGLRGLWEANHMEVATTPFGFLFGGHDAMARGDFEPEETRLLSDRLGQADVFVDVGANFGFYTCLAGSRGVHCVALEPHPENLLKLYRNIEANRFTDVEVFPMAVTSKPKVVTLFGSGTGASLLGGWAGGLPIGGTVVPSTTLDIILEGRFSGQRLLIKMDIEGAETEALRGASSTLARSPRPSWLIEICLTEHHPAGSNPDFVATFELMWAHGYEARTADEKQLLITPSDVQHWASTGQRDFAGYNVFFSAS